MQSDSKSVRRCRPTDLLFRAQPVTSGKKAFCHLISFHQNFRGVNISLNKLYFVSYFFIQKRIASCHVVRHDARSNTIQQKKKDNCAPLNISSLGDLISFSFTDSFFFVLPFLAITVLAQSWTVIEAWR